MRVTYPEVAGATQEVVYNYTYDGERNLASASDGASNYLFDYTSLGLLEKITAPNLDETEMTYSGVNLLSVSDPIGTRYSLAYDDPSLPNAPTSITDGSGKTWAIEYNDEGQPTRYTLPSGSPTGETVLAYEENTSSPNFGYLKSVTDPLGNVIGFDGYSSVGDLTQFSTDPDPATPATRNQFTQSFDGAHRLRSFVHPDSQEYAWNYEGRNLTSTEDENSTVTSYTWCPTCDGLLTITKPLGWMVELIRDADDAVAKLKDPREHLTTYTYGKSKESTSMVYPDGAATSFLYDDALRLRQIKNARNQEENWSYDVNGRLGSITFPTTGETTVSYSYRSDDSLQTVVDDSGTITYEYYPNRLVSAVNYDYSTQGLVNVQRLEYTYTNDQRLETITWKNGTTTVGTWTYGYDTAGRMTSAAMMGASANFTYDGEDKLLTQTNSNTTSTVYGYNDARGWVSSITHKQGATPFRQYSMTFDNGNNTIGDVTGVTELDSSNVSYTYDALYRLTGETRTGTNPYTKSYAYDTAGNITDMDGVPFGTYDEGNKLTLSNGTIAHDADGNITAVEGAGISDSTFTWNTRAKLKMQETDTGLAQVSSTFGYDSFGRRVWSTTASQLGMMMMSGGGPVIVKKFYIYSGDLLLGEIQNPNPRTAYLWGPGGLISQKQLNTGNHYFYHFGPQGETRALTNSAGSVANTYTYTAYGIPVASTGSVVNNLRYGGRYGYYFEGRAGLLLAGHRWYSPHMGRWISRDPISYGGGDTNLYGYVAQNPVNLIDPAGLGPEDWHFDPTDHGGPHFQREMSGKSQRYSVETFAPLEHKGVLPPSLSTREINALRESRAFRRWSKFSRDNPNWRQMFPRMKSGLRCLGALSIFQMMLDAITGRLEDQLIDNSIDLCIADPEMCNLTSIT